MANMEQEIQVIKKNLKASHDRNKSYEGQDRLFKEFQVGEQVCLRIKPKKSSLRIGTCAKLAPRFCGPFITIKRIECITYHLGLRYIVKVHDVFHVSLLKKYVKYANHVIEWFVLQVEPEGEFRPEA